MKRGILQDIFVGVVSAVMAGLILFRVFCIGDKFPSLPDPFGRRQLTVPTTPRVKEEASAVLNVRVDPDTVGIKIGSYTPVAYRFREVNGVQTTVGAQDVRWLLDNGIVIGAVKNARILGGSFTVAPKGAHDLIDNVYMPPDIAEKAYTAGSSRVQLETTFVAVDGNDRKTRARAVLRIGILR